MTHPIDSHCHIHDSEFYPENGQVVYERARSANVMQMICVGTDRRSSREAVEFAATHDGCYATLGIHPHDAKQVLGSDYLVEFSRLISSTRDQRVIVGVGEIGLDYYYDHSPRDIQQRVLEEQLQFAVDHDLPVSFHVRDAYDDFWPLFDNFHNLRGVLHSFTDTADQAERGLERGLYIGLNGISTFTKNAAQAALYAQIPLQKILLETDAPFLTPSPYRGNINEPAYVVRVAEHIAQTRNLGQDFVVSATTTNTKALFSI